MEKQSPKKLLKMFLGFSMSAWINAVLNFLLTPIITRIVEPGQLGQIDMFITFCNMFVYASTLGMHQAYMRFFDDLPQGATKENLLSFSVRYSSLGAGVAGLICLVLYRYFSTEILGNSNFIISILMYIYILATGFIAIIKTKPRMYGDIVLYTIIAILESVLVKVSYLSLSFTRDVYTSIMFMVFITTTLAFVCLCRNRKQVFVGINSIEKESKIEIFQYALPTIPVMFITNVNASIPKMFLNHYYNSSSVGIYAGCLTLVNIITLVQTGINVFWVPYVFKNYRDNQKQIQQVHLIISFVIAFCGLCLIAGQDVIFFVLGSNYRASKAFYAFLLASPICHTIGETLGIGINIKKKTYWNIFITGIALLCNLAMCAVLVPKYGNIGASISVMVSSALMVIIKAIIGERYYQVITSKIKSFSTLGTYIVSSVISYILIDKFWIRIFVVSIFALILVLLNIKSILGIFRQIDNKNLKGEKT